MAAYVGVRLQYFYIRFQQLFALCIFPKLPMVVTVHIEYMIDVGRIWVSNASVIIEYAILKESLKRK